MHARRLPFLLLAAWLACTAFVVPARAQPADGTDKGDKAAKELSPKDLKIGPQGIGPIGASTRATLAEVTALLPGFEVESTTRKVNGVSSIVLVASYIGQPVLEVVAGARDAVALVRVVSPDVASPLDEVYVGGTLDDAGRLAECRLLGEKGVDGTACKLKGFDYVSFLFATAADSWTGKGLPPADVLKGVRVTAIEWALR